MLMNYLTAQGPKKQEELVGIAANEREADWMKRTLDYGNNDRLDVEEQTVFRIRSLYHLLKERVIIPPELKWIVESDRKHQEREIAGRIENLCDEQALSFKKV